MKPIAGKNKAPFGIAGIAVLAAKDAEGNVLTNVRILKQRSGYCFDLQSTDGSVVYDKIQLVAEADGSAFTKNDSIASIRTKLKSSQFVIMVTDPVSGEVAGFAKRLLQHKTILGDGTVVFNANLVDGSVIPVIAVTGVTISNKTASIEVDGTVQINSTVAPANASNKAVSYASSAPAIATVNASGLVTGVSEGSATITVTTADGAKKDTAVITVA